MIICIGSESQEKPNVQDIFSSKERVLVAARWLESRAVHAGQEFLIYEYRQGTSGQAALDTAFLRGYLYRNLDSALIVVLERESFQAAQHRGVAAQFPGVCLYNAISLVHKQAKKAYYPDIILAHGFEEAALSVNSADWNFHVYSQFVHTLEQHRFLAVGIDRSAERAIQYKGAHALIRYLCELNATV